MEKEMKQSKNLFKSLEKQTLWLFVILVAFVVVVSVLKGGAFLSLANFQSMGWQLPEFGIMALGMMICMISGGIDLSIVGVSNLCGIIAAVIMKGIGVDNNIGILVAVVVALLVGMACGAVNGFLIGNLRIPAMLVTLCGQQIFMGIGIVITKGPAISGLPAAYQVIGNGLAFGVIPISLLIFVGCVVVLSLVLRYTLYGQQLLFMGSNPVASRYSGINNLSVTMKTYITSGLFAAIAGIIVSSHLGSAKSDYGAAYTLQTLLIVILGGVSPSGGKGKISTVVLAIVILQVISSTFNLFNLNAFLKEFVFGLLLIAVMMFQYFSVSTLAERAKVK